MASEARNTPANQAKQSSFKLHKSGPIRLEGQLASGDASTSRGATARAGTLASNSGSGGSSDRVVPYPSYAEGTKQKFRPTTKGGSVRGGSK